MELLVDIGQKIYMDSLVALSFYKIKAFCTRYLRKPPAYYVEWTPYNKGNLWKIRCYLGYYKVFYGTQEKAYCTTIDDCLKIINQ